jgi:plastocyanin
MPRIRSSLAVAFAALALAGCGDAGPTVRERTPSFTVTLDDYTIRPQRLRVPAGRELTVTVINRGRLGHTFRIRGATRNVLRFTTVRPGERKTRRFSPGAGRYEMYCALANHEELGMNGSFTVG